MIIATRVLKLRNPSGDIDIPIRIFAPEQEGKSWFCKFEGGWPDGTLTMPAGGVGAVQAGFAVGAVRVGEPPEAASGQREHVNIRRARPSRSSAALGGAARGSRKLSPRAPRKRPAPTRVGLARLVQ
jgi:hypothetical protein